MEKLTRGEYSPSFSKPAETEEERKKYLELAKIKLEELRKLAKTKKETNETNR